MYGYSYGTAAADVWHTVDYNAMIYPGYVPSNGSESVGVKGVEGLKRIEIVPRLLYLAQNGSHSLESRHVLFSGDEVFP